MRFRVEVGLLILSLAFAVSIFGGLSVCMDWHLTATLEWNPHRYLDYVWDAFLFLILPPAVGLAYSIIAFVRERKSPTGVLKRWLPLTVFGGFFFLWGVLTLRFSYLNYCEVVRWVDAYGAAYIADLITKIYVAASVGRILWLFTGLLFMLSPVFKMVGGERHLHNR